MYVCTHTYTNTNHDMFTLQLQMESDGGDTCVNFTPSQYITIYHSRLQTRDSNQLDAMCLLQMRTRNWQDKTLVI